MAWRLTNETYWQNGDFISWQSGSLEDKMHLYACLCMYIHVWMSQKNQFKFVENIGLKIIKMLIIGISFTPDCIFVLIFFVIIFVVFCLLPSCCLLWNSLVSIKFLNFYHLGGANLHSGVSWSFWSLWQEPHDKKKNKLPLNFPLGNSLPFLAHLRAQINTTMIPVSLFLKEKYALESKD